VFFAIGFETTTPPTAVAIRQADAEGLRNFSVFCNHVLTPAAIANILESPEVRELGAVPLDGFIGPAHVSTVIGSQPYESETIRTFNVINKGHDSLLVAIEPVQVGDYVLNHVGFAIRRIPPEEVQETLALFDQILDVTGAKDDLMAADVRGEMAAGKDKA